MALDWRRAKIRETRDIRYENDILMNDLAARWLQDNDQRMTKKASKRSRKKTGTKNQATKYLTDVSDGFVVYTDGACEPNPGVGGWGFAAYEDRTEIYSECGGQQRSTNNIMEMTAMLKALQWLSKEGRTEDVTVYSDSQYVVKGCILWRHKWKRNGWRRSGSGLVANIDLWKELSLTLDQMKVRIEWCKGHVGIIGNERADCLSYEGRMFANKTGLDPQLVEQLRYSI